MKNRIVDCGRRMTPNALRLAACLSVALVTSNASAAIIWTESVDGDLPGLDVIPMSTDFGPLGPGEYTFVGNTSVSGEFIDSDVIAFTTTNAFTVDIDAMSGDDFLVRFPEELGSFTSGVRQVSSAPDIDIFFGAESAGDWYIEVLPVDGSDGLSTDYTLTINVIPAPTTAGIFAGGVLGLIGARRRRKAD